MDDEGRQTKAELLKLAKRLGASEPEFDRWRRAGLLPRPCEIKRLGRGRGSEAIYPAHTAAQLRRLCQLHFGDKGVKRERRLRYLAWKLWWEGKDIPVSRVREFLMRDIAAKVDREREMLLQASPEQRAKWAKELATKSFGRHPGPRGRVRQRLRSDTFAFVCLVFDALSGGLLDTAEARRLLEKGTGTDRARTDTLAGQHLLTNDVDYMPAVQEAVAHLGGNSLVAQVEKMSDEELAEARLLTREYLGTLQVSARFGRDAKGQGGLGLGEFLYLPETPKEQAMSMLATHCLRKLAAENAAVTDPAEAVAVLRQVAELYPQVEAARMVEPFRDLLSNRRIEEVAADPAKVRVHERDLRKARFYQPDSAKAVDQAIEAARKRQEDGKEGNP